MTGDTFNLHRLTQPNWTEFGATYSDYDVGHPWATPGGDYDPTPAQSVYLSSFQNLVFDQVKPLVEDAIENRGGMLDVLIKGTADSRPATPAMLFIGQCRPGIAPNAGGELPEPDLVRRDVGCGRWSVDTSDAPVWSVAVQDEGC